MLAMDRWSCEGKIGSESEWNEAYKNLTLASKINPWSADPYLHLGNLFEWRATAKTAWDTSSKDMRNESIHYYRKALEQRPTWGIAWNKLVQSMVLNRQVDEDTYFSLEMAFKYGKYQPEIAEKLIWLSVGIWKHLPAPLKEEVREVVRFYLVDDMALRKYTVLALRFNWFEELDNILTNPKDKEYLDLVRSNPQLMKQNVNNFMGQSANQICS